MSNRLSDLNDRQLLAALQKLRSSERENTLEILHHLLEVERRKLHLKLGYSSLFVYCTEHLCYSESSAGRRVQSARCLARFPQIEPLIKRGDINLVTLGLVASLLTPQNVDWFMDKIRNKRQREVEAIANAFRPATHLRDRVLRVSVPAPVTPLSSATTPSLGVSPASPGNAATADTQQTNAGSLANATATPQLPSPPGQDGVSAGPLLVNVGSNSHNGSEKTPIPIATVPKLYIQFLADDNFMRDYNEACALLSNTLPRPTFAAVFGVVLRDYLARNSPKRRQERRDAKRASQQQQPGTPQEQTSASHEEACASYDASASASTCGTPRRPPIPAQTRDAVFLRDEGRCTFVGSDGRRCHETHNLHVDHIRPVARNGSSDPSNLRLLCSHHNRLEAQRLFGERRMTSILERNRGSNDP